MKFIKRLFFSLCGIIILLCGLATFIALSPGLSDQLADRLYGSDRNTYIPTPTIEVPPTIVEEPEDSLLTDGTVVNEPLTLEPEPETQKDLENLQIDVISKKPTSAVSAYEKPTTEQVSVPQEVQNKAGYTPLSEDSKQIEDTEANSLQSSLSVGETGNNLTFDSEYYPYYYMLSENQRSIYRQIYANAMALTATFKPQVTITAEQLKLVFEALYNDHPELFWLDTGYSSRYMKSGQCVEVTLQFNDTSKNLETAKTSFNNAANEIINGAKNLSDHFEKEKYVHDAILNKVTYNTGAAMNQSAYSALVNGQSVCAGYARAFQYIMQQLGIPTYYCTGYSGENHAWNIVKLYNDFYNVDTTWNDTEPSTYNYFNKTDAEFNATHIRRNLSVNLPACNGTMYAIQNTPEASNGVDAAAYFDDCYNAMLQAGIGSNQFVITISPSAWSEVESAYQNGTIRDGYLARVLNALGGSSCNLDIQVQEQANGDFVITHNFTIVQ